MPRSRWIIPLSLSLALPAWGQTASEIAAAKQWFTQGMALEEKGQFGDALEQFKKALAVKKTPQIVFHVALCEFETGALVEALVDFGRAVEIAKAEGNAQVESAANAELIKLRPRVPTVEIVVQGGATPTRVLLNGTEIAAATLGSPIPVNPGSHEIVAEFEGGSVRRKVSVAERARSKIEIAPPVATADTPGAPAPTPAATKAPPAAPAEPDHPTPEPTASPSVLPWVFVGGGVVFAAGGFYLWKLRGDQIDALDELGPEQDRCPIERAGEMDDAESKGKTYTALAFAGWGVGAAAITVGTVMLLGSSSKERATAEWAPVIGPGFSGASLRGRF